MTFDPAPANLPTDEKTCTLQARSRIRLIMSYSISTMLTRNLHDVFGENDPARRRAAIADW